MKAGPHYPHPSFTIQTPRKPTDTHQPHTQTYCTHGTVTVRSLGCWLKWTLPTFHIFQTLHSPPTPHSCHPLIPHPTPPFPHPTPNQPSSTTHTLTPTPPLIIFPRSFLSPSLLCCFHPSRPPILDKPSLIHSSAPRKQLATFPLPIFASLIERHLLILQRINHFIALYSILYTPYSILQYSILSDFIVDSHIPRRRSDTTANWSKTYRVLTAAK